MLKSVCVVVGRLVAVVLDFLMFSLLSQLLSRVSSLNTMVLVIGPVSAPLCSRGITTCEIKMKSIVVMSRRCGFITDMVYSRPPATSVLPFLLIAGPLIVGSSTGVRYVTRQVIG